MDYSNYIKEHPNSLIITNTEEEFVDVGTKLEWKKETCIINWNSYKDSKDNQSIIAITNDYILNYSGRKWYFEREVSKYKDYKRISYSEFLGTTDNYQIY